MSRSWVQISAGRGPVEVRRFVARLAERMEALCEERGLAVVDVTVHGDEDAPASVEILVEGDARRCLEGELGTHALVERSAARGKAARKRWFAGWRSTLRGRTPGRARARASTWASSRSRPAARAGREGST